ncbi:MAG: glycosyl hydrolase family 25, partial [Streptococcus suis]
MRKKLKPIVVIGFFLTFFAIIFISGVYGNRATAGKETTITQSNTNPTSIETIPSSSYYITNA